MNLPTKPNSLQTYQLVLYKRALHPELFPLMARRSLVHGGYDFEAWVMPGAHLLRFRLNGFCACELVTDQESGLPTEGAVTAFPCAGEKDFEHKFAKERVKYVTTVQTETLTENLYTATYNELVDFGKEINGLTHKWTDPDAGRCMTMLDLQRHNREVHAQSYHLIAQGGLVLRTQSIFEHK